MMDMCLSIVTLLLSEGLDQRYVVFSSSWVCGECCQVLVDSRGGIFSAFIEIQFNLIELSDLLLSSLQLCRTLFYCLYLDDTQRVTHYITDDK